jgi:phosphoglycerate kinase
MILDIGPRSIEHVISVLARVKTLVWNGPFGAFEMDHSIAAPSRWRNRGGAYRDAQARLSCGRGDTVSALNAAGVVDRFTYVSTAGGAFLEWMEGKALPGVEVLRIK